MAPGEYILRYISDGVKYAIITYSDKTEQYTLIFNGKRIPLGVHKGESPSSGEYVYGWGFMFGLGYLNVNEPDGYIFIDRNESGYFVNRRGKIEGPYEYAVWAPTDYPTYDSERTYYYVLAGRVYENANGKIKRAENIINLYDHKLSVNGQFIDNVYNLSIKGDHCSYTVTEPYGTDNYRYPLYFDDKCIEWDYNFDKGHFYFNEHGYYAYFHKTYSGYKLDTNGNNVEDFPSDFSNLSITGNGDLVYIYKQDGKEHIHLPGMKNEFVLDDVRDFNYLENGTYSFFYKQDGRWYFRFSKEKQDIAIDDEPRYFHSSNTIETGCHFIYRRNDKLYIHIYEENKAFGPYDAISDIHVKENAGCHFAYKKNDKWYVHSPGAVQDYGPYDSISFLDINEKGNCIYAYERNGKYYISSPKEKYESGPYTVDKISQVMMAENGEVIFVYSLSGLKFLRTKDEVRGPFNYCRLDSFKGGDDFWYSYNDIYYLWDNLDFKSPDGKHDFFSCHSYEYVVIDGRRFGKESAFKAYWDQDRKSFVWYAVEENADNREQLVLYEYRPQ